MLRIALALIVCASPALATEGPRRAQLPDPAFADPPDITVTHTQVEVQASPSWARYDIGALCGVEAEGGRLRIEEVSGPDAATASDVALDGPTTLQVRAPEAGSHTLVVEFSATDARGNQAFDRCTLIVR